MAINRSVAFVIEGMGSDATKSAGIAWYYGRSTIETPGDYEWVGGRGSGEGLVDYPTAIGSTVDPFECSVNGSAQQFKLHATDEAKALWLYRPAEADDLLNADITESATSITFAGNASWSASDDGTVVWLRDEAIRLDTHQAGSTFTCTRGHWSTTASLHPKGVHVWKYNPRRVNRLAKLLLYDHDAGTTSQAWQGFVDTVSINGPVIDVRCTDILSRIQGAKLNRGRVPNLRNYSSGAFVQSGFQQVFGKLNMRDGTRAKRRVNKSDAVAPHWVAVQAADALFYVKYENGVAQFIDSTNHSEPQLSSFIDPEEYPRNGQLDGDIYELLVVDDRDISALGTFTTYANARSSSRDLGKPLHPVALTMALWTSGPATTPGVAGTGESGEEPVFGAGTFAQKTQYFTGSGREVCSSDATLLTGQCAIARRIGNGTNLHVKLIDDAGGTEWTMPATAIDANGSYSAVATSETHVFAILDGEDGTYVSAGRALARSIKISDGTVEWDRGFPGFPASTFGPRCAAYAPTDDTFFCAVTDSADEVQAIDGTAGTIDGDTSDAPVGSSEAVGLLDDESYLLVGGISTEQVMGLPLPFVNGGTPDWELDFKAGSDTTLTWSNWASVGSAETQPTIRRDRQGGAGAWICGGFNFGTYEPYLMHITVSGGTPSVDIEIDVSSDMGITSGSDNVTDVCVDKFGHVYAVIINSGSVGSADTDIVQYDETGAFVRSFADDGISLPTSGVSAGFSIAVDEDGTLYLGDTDGYVWVYTR